jgi:hypothetical protein
VDVDCGTVVSVGDGVVVPVGAGGRVAVLVEGWQATSTNIIKTKSLFNTLSS